MCGGGLVQRARASVCGFLRVLVRVTYISEPRRRVSGRASAAATCFPWETGFPSDVSRVFGWGGLPPQVCMLKGLNEGTGSVGRD